MQLNWILGDCAFDHLLFCPPLTMPLISPRWPHAPNVPIFGLVSFLAKSELGSRYIREAFFFNPCSLDQKTCNKKKKCKKESIESYHVHIRLGTISHTCLIKKQKTNKQTKKKPTMVSWGHQEMEIIKEEYSGIPDIIFQSHGIKPRKRKENSRSLSCFGHACSSENAKRNFS